MTAAAPLRSNSSDEDDGTEYATGAARPLSNGTKAKDAGSTGTKAASMRKASTQKEEKDDDLDDILAEIYND